MSITRNDNLEIRGPKPTRTTDVMGTRLENTYQRKEDIPMNMRFLWCKTTEADGSEWRLEDPNDLTSWTEFKPIGGSGIQEPQSVGDWVRHWNGTIGSWVAASSGGGGVDAATQAEVDAGAVGDKYVSPATLSGSVMQNNLAAVIHRTQGLDYTPAVPGSADTNLQTDHIGIAVPIRMEGSQVLPTGPADRGRELATFGTVGTMINQALTAHQETDPVFVAAEPNLPKLDADNTFTGNANVIEGTLNVEDSVVLESDVEINENLTIFEDLKVNSGGILFYRSSVKTVSLNQSSNDFRVELYGTNTPTPFTIYWNHRNLFKVNNHASIFDGDIIGSTSGTKSLGESIVKWKDLFLSGQAFGRDQTGTPTPAVADDEFITKEYAEANYSGGGGSGIPEPTADGSFARKKLGTIYSWEAISAGGGDAYLGRDQIFTRKNTFKSDTNFTIQKDTDNSGSGFVMAGANDDEKLNMFWRGAENVFYFNVNSSPMQINSQRVDINAILGTHLSRGYQLRGVEEIKNDGNGSIIVSRDYLDSFGYRPYKEEGIAGEVIEQGMVVHKRLDGKYYKSASTDTDIGAQPMAFAYEQAIADATMHVVTAMSWPCAGITGGCTAHIGKPIYLSATAGEYTLTPPTTGVVKLIGRIAPDSKNWFNEDRFLHLESDFTWMSEDRKKINGVEMAFGSGGSGIPEPGTVGKFLREITTVGQPGTWISDANYPKLDAANVFTGNINTFNEIHSGRHYIITNGIKRGVLGHYLDPNDNSKIIVGIATQSLGATHVSNPISSDSIADINNSAYNKKLVTKEWVISKIPTGSGIPEPTGADGDYVRRKAGTTFTWEVAPTGGGAYLPLAGGTMTGNIVMNATSRLRFTAPQSGYIHEVISQPEAINVSVKYNDGGEKTQLYIFNGHGPTNDNDIATKKYVDDNAGGTISGTGGISTVGTEVQGQGLMRVSSTHSITGDRTVTPPSDVKYNNSNYINKTTLNTPVTVTLEAHPNYFSTLLYKEHFAQITDGKIIFAAGSGVNIITPNSLETSKKGDSATATWITATDILLTINGEIGLQNIVEDHSPQLGEDLDLDSHSLKDNGHEISLQQHYIKIGAKEYNGTNIANFKFSSVYDRAILNVEHPSFSSDIEIHFYTDRINVDQIIEAPGFKVPLSSNNSYLKANGGLSDISTPPASSSATGRKGDVIYGSDYVYVCVDTNTWKRTTLSTW